MLEVKNVSAPLDSHRCYEYSEYFSVRGCGEYELWLNASECTVRCRFLDRCGDSLGLGVESSFQNICITRSGFEQ